MNNVAAGADGSRMQYATVNMEEGHDTLIVEGYNHTNQPAIVGSSVSMGVGNLEDDLRITGSGNLRLVGNWTKGNTLELDSVTYAQHNSGDVSIYIQEGIAIL